MSGGRSRQLGELHEGDDEHRGAERDEPVADTPAREVGADAHEEEHAGEFCGRWIRLVRLGPATPEPSLRSPPRTPPNLHE